MASEPRQGDSDNTLLRKIAELLEAGGGGGGGAITGPQVVAALGYTPLPESGGPDLAVADGGTGASTAAGARTNLGLGTMATQNANAVAITGGTAVLSSVTSDVHLSTAATVNAQVGTTYTLDASDNGKVVTLNNAASITLTVPAGLGAGFSCTLIQLGAGQVTVTPSGTTVNSYGSLTKIAGQHGSASLFAYAANVFNLSGALTA